jgi:TonB family protein
MGSAMHLLDFVRRTVVFFAVLTVAAPNGWAPARYRDGMAPPIQLRALGGGEVLLEATISDSGEIAGIKTLRATPPFTDAVERTVRGWHFSPAEEEVEPVPGEPVEPRRRKRVNAKVLIAAVFRPPTLNTPTFGAIPKTVGSASDEIPFPITTTAPLYPPRALYDGVVLLEVRVGTDGRVSDSKVILSAPPFDGPALDAARRWMFRPALVHGVPAETFAYITFGFRQPITAK